MIDVLPERVGVDGAVDVLSGGTVANRALRTRAQSSGVSPDQRFTLWIAAAGAVAYGSWPLGFLVNPSLAGTALASSFEGRSQPFSWLFILLDCFAGLCTGIVSARLLRTRHSSRSPGKVLILALAGYATFGVATAVDAIVPLRCGTSSAQACAAQMWPLTPDDLLTAIAVLGLFVAVLAMLVACLFRTPFLGLVPATVVITVAGWGSVGVAVLAGSTFSPSAAAAQYAFLTLTSLLMLIVPLQVTRFLRSLQGSSPQNASTPERGFCSRQGALSWRGSGTAFPPSSHPAEQSRVSAALDTQSP